jgi:hypothetical protein
MAFKSSLVGNSVSFLQTTYRYCSAFVTDTISSSTMLPVDVGLNTNGPRPSSVSSPMLTFVYRVS